MKYALLALVLGLTVACGSSDGQDPFDGGRDLHGDFDADAGESGTDSVTPLDLHTATDATPDIPDDLVQDVPLADVPVEDISTADAGAPDVPRFDVEDVEDVRLDAGGGEDIAFVDASPEDTSGEDVSVDDVSVDDVSVDDVSVDDVSVDDVSVDDVDGGGPWGTCSEGYGDPMETGRLDTAEIREASGIAASMRQPGLLWMHNDSGDTARLFAVRHDGVLVAVVTLSSVWARDFEDIAAARCPDGEDVCLWVADVGNNNRNRTDLAVYVLPEPVLTFPEGRVEQVEVAPQWTFAYEYPDDNLDCEGVAVPPDGSTFYAFEKANEEFVRVFRHPGPLVDGVPVRLQEVAAFTAPGWAGWPSQVITGADIHPSGDRLILRTYHGTGEFRFGPGEWIDDLAALTGEMVAFGPSSESQGEAVCYAADGRGFWTISEQGTGRQPLHFYPCQ